MLENQEARDELDLMFDKQNEDLGKYIEHLASIVETVKSPKANQKRALDLAIKSLENDLGYFRFIHSSRRSEEEFILDIFKLNKNNANKRWSDAEVDQIVEWRAKGYAIEAIAVASGRTTQAIATKLSSAVGIARTEKVIRGMFVGTLNEEEIQGMIDGIVKK